VRSLPPALFDQVAATFYAGALGSSIRDLLDTWPQCRVLDVPCGTGSLAGLSAGASYFGLDVSPDRVDRARRKNPWLCLAVGDAAWLPFPSGTFDRVLVSGLFHHVDDALARAIVDELARVLHPNGRIVVLEAIWPRRWYNLPGSLARAMDEGKHVRNAEEYEPLWSHRFASDTIRFPMRFTLEYLLARLRLKTTTCD
jgi:SAM-dependent methyltransferase